MLDAWTIKEWLLILGSLFILIGTVQIVMLGVIMARVSKLLSESELVRLIAPAIKSHHDD